MNLIDEVEYEHINIKILHGNGTTISLIITQVKFIAIDADDTSYQS